MFKRFLNYIFELAKIVIISLVIIIPVRYYLIQPFYVKGASMEPNFHDHEYLIINEISYRFHNPERGDIVVFRYPLNPQDFYIKRVIGLPGERIQIKGGGVYIFNDLEPDGFLLIEPYLEEEISTYGRNEETIELGSSEYYVLGDNRSSSQDSRSFGPVNITYIIGKVLLRGWPPNKFKLFNEAAYPINLN